MLALDREGHIVVVCHLGWGVVQESAAASSSQGKAGNKVNTKSKLKVETRGGELIDNGSRMEYK